MDAILEIHYVMGHLNRSGTLDVSRVPVFYIVVVYIYVTIVVSCIMITHVKIDLHRICHLPSVKFLVNIYICFNFFSFTFPGRQKDRAEKIFE